jgi:DNA-binding MarR family transcriptional regulator
MQLLPGENNGGAAKAVGEEECARRVLDVTPPVVRAIRNLMRNHRLAGLSVPQFRAMALLSREPEASLSCVADYVGSSLPAASRMIEGMVAKKLVKRCECCKDRRQISLGLTARGESALRASRTATQRQLAQRLGTLSAGQRQAIVEGMACLAEIFGSDAVHDRRPQNGAAKPG